ncbi:MAG: hypothetical protein A2289_17910 [Deltaproteobacteria bacterium RIFOXYA12_FULL_58_15]|nr:MAG: hypothetical protein A2289_17910 [Deltaproteobacteria bacterium RIFOXYA12_FULL_58_15]OGR09054.1 MAG: hypothetical protein A2341_25820 [Deltaproteobacteria bacterium RIFOXYB12_FULL_58_9]
MVAKKTTKKKTKKKAGAHSWPRGNDWRQSGLCSEAQADGVPCTEVGRHCEICERADPVRN